MISDFDRLQAGGIQNFIARESAKIPTVEVGTCRHCGQPIVFKPLWLDGKQPNPPVWFHPPGSKTCSTRPEGWPEGSWPLAEPIPAPSVSTKED